MKTQAFISGHWVDSEIGTQFPVTDPATGELIAEVSDCGAKLASFAIDAAHDAYNSVWKKRTAKERSEVLLNIKALLLKNLDSLAILMSRENGKPLKEAKGEIHFSASFFDWFAGEARRAYGETIPGTEPGKELLTIRRPLGVAALITPWNFPIGMLARKVSAALAAGCTCVIKPAEDTPLTALEFVRICHEAGVPDGVINIIPCSRTKASAIGELFCNHPKVAVVSFTGSTETGKWLYSKAAGSMKKLHMELGGNAPFIVFNDSDIDLAVSGLIASKFRNTGQTCVTANRILIQEKIFYKFTEKFIKAVDNLKIGPGLKDLDISCMINDKQLERLERIVNESVEQGAKIIYGGGRLPNLGQRFYKPAVITNIRQNMALYEEEIFGPVAALISFETEEDVIKMANDTDKGLAAYAYTNDLRLAWKLSESLEFGMVGINEALLSTCEAPFGGIKRSGFGIEGSKYGMDEYSYVKYIGFGNQTATP